MITVTLGVLALVLILGWSVGITLFVFVLYPRLSNNKYESLFPISVPGWKTKLQSNPPFNATVDDIAIMNRCLLDEAVKHGLKRKDVKKKLDNIRLKFIPHDPAIAHDTGGKLDVHIYDPWGGRDKDGKLNRVAGWHEGDQVTIVYNKHSVLDDTGYAHEATHEIQELSGDTDYAHKNKKFWGPDGVDRSAKKQYRYIIDATDF